MFKFTAFFLVIAFLFIGCAPIPNQVKTEQPDVMEKPNEAAIRIESEVSDMIHINQIGFRPNDSKVAMINGHYGTFHIVRTSDNVIVFEGTTTGEELNDVSTGDKVFFADFSDLNESGTFFLSMPALGRSYDFVIDKRVYREIKDAMLKFMYFQRCGVGLLSEHAGIWARKACHLKDGYVLGQEDLFKEASGGWHDAGDYGKYTVPTAVTLAGLLLAYELFPNSFNEDINIPESGNNIPDVLDESRFALEWLLKMQDIYSGGVHHKLSTRNFPGFIMPDQDHARRYLTTISPTATGTFAAIMAMAARLFAKIDSEFSDKAIKAAESAWEWLIANPNAPNYTNPPGIQTGEYGDWSHADERYWASVELYRATGKQQYHEFMLENRSLWNMDLFGFGWQAVAGFGSASYLFMDPDKQDEEFATHLREELISQAEHFVRLSGFNGYRISLLQDDYFWGSNMLVMNRAIHLIIAYLTEPNSEFANNARDHLHYLLGRNALSRSYVTGFGGNPPMHPHHRPSGADRVEDPVPGMVAGGPNSRLQDPTAQRELTQNMPPARAYIDMEGSWSTNEVTIYWNSPAVFVAAFFDRDH